MDVKKREEQGWECNVFVDLSTSESRGPEFAVGVSTCIRPTHPIYSTLRKRVLSGKELLSLQGVWAHDMENPEALVELMKDHTLACSFAGNAFSTTVLQAKLIASLVNGNGLKRCGGALTTPSQSTPSSHATCSNAISTGRSDTDREVSTCRTLPKLVEWFLHAT